MTDKNFKSFVGVFVFLVLAYEFEGKRMADPKDSEELSLEELAKERFNLRIKRGSGLNPKPNLFRENKITIARVKTILSEMKNGK